MGMLSAALALAMATPAPMADDIPVRVDATQATTTQPTLGSMNSAPDTIALTRDRFNRMTLAVDIAGHGTFDFLIDTGAQRSVLSAGLANRLGLARGEPLHVTGLAGARSVDTVQLDGMTIGQRKVGMMEVPVFPDSTMETDGIVGLDSLKNQRVLLDFRNNRIQVTPSAKPQHDDGYEIVVSARERHGQLIMGHALVDGIDTAIIVDTGADAAVGNRALQRAMAHQNTGRMVTLSSVTGQTISAELGLARHVQINRILMSDVEIAFVDSPAFVALKLIDKPAMLIGIHELRSFGRVAIDFPQRKILFDVSS